MRHPQAPALHRVPCGARGIGLALLLAALAAPGLAGDEHAIDPAPGRDEAETLQAGRQSRERSFVVLPMPKSSPALGSGLTLAAVMYYQHAGSARPWMTGGGAMRTSNGSQGAAIFQKAYLGGDRYRALLVGAKADLHLHFYGIGEASIDRGISIEQRATAWQGDVLRKVADNHYLGLRLRHVEVETRVPLEYPQVPELEIPPLELDMRLAGPGLLYEYDTRDVETSSSAGDYVRIVAQWNLDSWGADRQYARVTAAWNRYRRLGPDRVLAMRVAGCAAGDDAPFFELCSYGSGADLRGYESGRHRDRTLLAAQAEYRLQFHPRWGAVVFGGIGGVAPAPGEFQTDSLLPAAGVGLRFKASTAYNVNVSLDYARGEDSDAVYVSIGEAF